MFALFSYIHHAHKFDLYPRKWTFIGYLYEWKAFRSYDLENDVVFTNRDVQFQECIFSFQNRSLIPKQDFLTPLPIHDSPP